VSDVVWVRGDDCDLAVPGGSGGRKGNSRVDHVSGMSGCAQDSRRACDVSVERNFAAMAECPRQQYLSTAISPGLRNDTRWYENCSFIVGRNSQERPHGPVISIESDQRPSIEND
jgi:hypothetical protein